MMYETGKSDNDVTENWKTIKCRIYLQNISGHCLELLETWEKLQNNLGAKPNT